MRRKNSTNKAKKPIIADNHLKPDIDIKLCFKNKLKPRTINQKNYIRTIAENTITFCKGVPGSGKTHIAIGMALEYLLSDKVEKIIITRPVVEAGERLGFLPGTAEEKLHPYLLPILDEINYFIHMPQYSKLKVARKLEVVPLALMRGRSFHNSFVVADECQNASYAQIKMLLTRIGMDSKMALTGDLGQSDLKYEQGGFSSIIDLLQGVNSIGFCELDGKDIVRNPIIADIVDRLESNENRS